MHKITCSSVLQLNHLLPSGTSCIKVWLVVCTVLLPILSCTSLPTAYSHPEKLYIDHIVRKIEIIGEARYPNLARHIDRDYQVEFQISIRHNGQLHRVELRHASGNHIIDDALLELIQYSAPYPPMSEDIDKSVLHIVKRWTFSPR